MATALKLLRLLPLILSTSSITYAHDHDLFFRAFLHPSHTATANKFIPSWMAAFMPHGGIVLINLYAATFITALLNNLSSISPAGFGNNGFGGASKFYYAGAAFTVGHFLFAKAAVELLLAMRDDEGKGRATDDMWKWVRLNVLRTLMMDLPGWVCYLLGALGSL